MGKHRFYDLAKAVRCSILRHAGPVKRELQFFSPLDDDQFSCEQNIN